LKDFDHILEVEITLLQSLQTFCRIIGNSHSYCNYNN
jgi:hypothetical protein